MINVTKQPDYFASLFNKMEVSINKSDYEAGDLFFLELILLDSKDIALNPANNSTAGVSIQFFYPNAAKNGTATVDISDVLQAYLPDEATVPAQNTLFQTDSSNYVGYYFRFGTLTFDENSNKVLTYAGSSSVKWAFRGAFTLKNTTDYNKYYANYIDYALFLTNRPKRSAICREEDTFLAAIVPTKQDEAATTQNILLKANFYYKNGSSDLDVTCHSQVSTIGTTYLYNVKPSLIQTNLSKLSNLRGMQTWLEYEPITPTSWRGINQTCALDGNGDNTGDVSFAGLEEYYVFSNVATGNVKVNSVEDADYIAPTYDTSVCPLVDRSPNFQFDTSTIRCAQADENTRTNANREAKKKDINPDSLTYNQYQNSGEFFYYDTDETVCPFPDLDPSISFSAPSTAQPGQEITLTATATDERPLTAANVEFFYRLGTSGAYTSLGTGSKSDDTYTKNWTVPASGTYNVRAAVEDSKGSISISNVVAITSSLPDNVINVDVASTFEEFYFVGSYQYSTLTVGAQLTDANGQPTTAPDNISVTYSYTFTFNSSSPVTNTVLVTINAGQTAAVNIYTNYNQPNNGTATIVSATPSVSGGRTVQI